MDATYTLDDVAEHKSKDDCWIVVDGGAHYNAARPDIPSQD
jgi:cytochrome b involved in lipid metabolism